MSNKLLFSSRAFRHNVVVYMILDSFLSVHIRDTADMAYYMLIKLYSLGEREREREIHNSFFSPLEFISKWLELIDGLFYFYIFLSSFQNTRMPLYICNMK